MTMPGSARRHASATLRVKAREAELLPSTLESRCRIFMAFLRQMIPVVPVTIGNGAEGDLGLAGKIGIHCSTDRTIFDARPERALFLRQGRGARRLLGGGQAARNPEVALVPSHRPARGAAGRAAAEPDHP